MTLAFCYALQDTASSLVKPDAAGVVRGAKLLGAVAIQYGREGAPAANQAAGTQESAAQKAATMDAAAQLRRIAMLRAQQAVLQGDKSQQELVSITLRIDGIRKQLVNNRIDSSEDRQGRLQEKVHQPLTVLLANDYEKLRTSLVTFQTAAMTDAGGGAQARGAVAATDQVLIALEAIKANMLDIESFSEIVDLVRGLLDDQEKLLSETEKERKRRMLESLK